MSNFKPYIHKHFGELWGTFLYDDIQYITTPRCIMMYSKGKYGVVDKSHVLTTACDMWLSSQYVDIMSLYEYLNKMFPNGIGQVKCIESTYI